ncbi:ATP-dependent helicase [Candidatus Roizmanbacteria bacterium]|nr:ATP-dependent helicase [Candidatus Roizmanbacteria bacterium]
MNNILNPAQQLAVTTHTGPILVIAGAGTGKTRVLEYRTVELIKKGIDPRAILLLTFTRRAAAEMLSRAARHDNRAQDVAGGTFHSFSLEMLKKKGKVLGLNSFVVLDRGDNEELVGKLISDLKLREKKYFPKKGTVTDILSKSVNKDTAIENILESDYPQFYDWKQALELIQTRFAAYKKERQLLDFDDLLLYFYELVHDFEGVRMQIQSRYHYIMIDEYQDTNKLQGKIVHELARGHENILIVGDEMQSIYRFRGAEFTNMINFPKNFERTQHITLETNYRSTQEILDLANAVLEQVEGDHFKKYLTSLDKRGTKPVYRQFKSPKEEAEWIADTILERNNKGIPLTQIAALFRAAYQSAPLEIELSARGIPFKKFGGIRFVETAHIKDVLCHLRVIVNPADELAWRRILLLLEGVGDKTADEIVSSIKYQVSSENAKYKIPNTKYMSAGLQNLFQLLNQMSQKDLTPGQKIADIINYYKPILRRIHDDYPAREQDLDALVEIVSGYTSDEELLNDLALDPPDKSALNGRTDDGEYVTLSTIHSAKGLEWNTVFVIGLVEGKFPVIRDNTKAEDIEEERRLFYVAVTRAKERLYLTSSHGRSRSFYDSWFFTRPSRFVEPLMNTETLETHSLISEINKVNPYAKNPYIRSDDIEEVGVDKF